MSELTWDTSLSTMNFKNLLESIQNASQLVPETVSYVLNLLERKILSSKRISVFMSQNIIETIINYLTNMNPSSALEENTVAVLLAIEAHNPKVVITNFWDRMKLQDLPQPNILRTIGKLLLSQGMVPYLGATWNHVLPLLRKAQTEEQRLGLCDVINGLTINALKHLALGSVGEEAMDITREMLSFKACLTLRVLFNRWPLKTKDKGQLIEQTLSILGNLFFLISPPKLKCQVSWLIRRLLTLSKENVKSFYIIQCLSQLLEALAVSGSGGKNMASKLDDLVVLLCPQVNWKTIPAGSQLFQNHKMALKSFHTMTRLYHSEMVKLFLNIMNCKDIPKVIVGLQIFRDVFQEVPQTMELKVEVMKTVINLIKEDSKSVRLPLLQFIEQLGVCNYFTLQHGNVIVKYLIRFSEIESTSDEEIRDLAINILHLVSLPKLIYLLCQPTSPMAFKTLCKTATDIAMKAQALGQAPYLSSYHRNPTEYPSPQLVFVNLLISSLKPYKAKEFGTISLSLLFALHPLTSLHPVIHFKLGQVWTREIPDMIQILEKHTEEDFIQKEWEKRLLLFSSYTLLAINNDCWLKDLIQVIFEKIHSFKWFRQKEEKSFLYRLIGYTLKVSDDHDFVCLMLVNILNSSSQEEELEKKGIGDAISIVATGHLKTVLNVLQDYSSILTDKDTSPVLVLKKDCQKKEWIKICSTIHTAYSRIFEEIGSDIGADVDFILSVIINHYENCIIEKDKDLKLNYLNSVVKLTSNLAGLDHPDFYFSCKIKMVYFMMELVNQEPSTSISSPIRQKAMMIITNFRNLKPVLASEEKKELLKVCFKNVIGLPPLDVMKAVASPKESQDIVNWFRDTLQALRKMLEGLVTEVPTWVQNYWESLDTWLHSQKDHERERALWCGVRILSFTARKHNFYIDIEFSQLGKLVRLLAILCQDHVDNISFLASQAVYNLYCIMLLKKQLNQEKKGIWEELPKKEGVYSACVFHNDTSEIAKAFAEYFTPKQLTSLVMIAMEGLVNNRAKISLASGQLMNFVMKERGKDMLKVDQIVNGIYDRLKSPLEPETRKETLQALCSLAGNNTHNVMTLLLKRPLPWEGINMELWRAFGTQKKTTFNVLQLLISILEERHYKQGYKEMSFRPVAVTCALCEMLSETMCKLAVLELYPRLLLAVLNHVYWVIEQNVPQKMVVYRKEGIQGSKSKVFDPVSCALEAVKTMLIAAEYSGVVTYADQYRGWDLLSCPQYYYMGVIELTSGLVRNCDSNILHRIMREVKPLLYSVDERQKVMARALFVQLLWHQSVAQTLGENFLSHLVKWIREPNLIMKEIGLRGISNLALHPGQVDILASLLPVIRTFLKDEELVAVQAVKGLRNIICYAEGIVTKKAFCSISNQLRPLINDERDQVRISAISALSHMLHQVYKFRPGPDTRKELYSFLVPLLISIQDNNLEVAKVCGKALTEWVIGIGWTSLKETFQNTIITDHVRILEETCRCLVGTSQNHLVGKLLFQSFGFLKNPRPFIRAAAITFIGQTVMKLNMNEIHEEDVQLLLNTLEDLKDDPVDSIQGLVSITIKKMETASYGKASVSSGLQLRQNFKIFGLGTKKRLFKDLKSKEEGKKDLAKCSKWSFWKSSEDSIKQGDSLKRRFHIFPRKILPQKYLLSTIDLDKSVHQVQKELKIS